MDRNNSPKLLDRVRQKIRFLHYSKEETITQELHKIILDAKLIVRESSHKNK